MLCATCDVPIGDGACPNFWCGREDRGFDVVWSVGAHEGEMRRAIAALKYRGALGRAEELARALATFVVEHAPAFDEVDLIVGTPGWISRSRPVDHVRQIMVALDRLIGQQWMLDAGAPVIVKRAPTRPMVEIGSVAGRRLWAAGEMRAALEVTEPRRVAGRRVLVVDDVFTDGSTLRETALALRGAGALAVSGLVVARRAMGAKPRSSPRPW